MAKRIMIFIDGSNMYHNMMSNFKKASLNYQKLSLKLTGGDRELIRTYYYNCPLDQTKDMVAYKAQQRFLNNLYQTPDLEVKLGRLQRKPDGTATEKGVDVKLAVDMLIRAYKNHYDVAILISGDGDFAQVVQEVKDQAKHVELAVFPNQRCYVLRQAADRVVELTSDFMKDCWL